MFLLKSVLFVNKANSLVTVYFLLIMGTKLCVAKPIFISYNSIDHFTKIFEKSDVYFNNIV